MTRADGVPAFFPLYSAFAAGYLLSYLYRTVNAVISPELTRDLALHPSSLGFLTSAYFIAFAAMQVPVGMLLDRYGPRRVEPVLLAIAATGALAFSVSDGLAGLTLGRGLIGAGVAACLMAPLKGLSVWYPPERQASLAGWMMVAGGLGALVATTPLDYALRFVSWRVVFASLSALTLAVAVWIWLRVPDTPGPHAASSFAVQWEGVKRVFGHPRFWWIAPLGGFGMGAFMAIQGLWAVPWMIEVEGLTRAAAAQVLLAMSLMSLSGYLFLGMFATRLRRRGILPRHLFGVGFALNALALGMIVAGAPGSPAWWSLYGLGAAANILLFAVINEGFPPEITGRANTAANLMMFVGSFASQWGIGLVADAARVLAGADAAGGLRIAFAVVLLLELATLAWFALGWRRHAVHGAVTAE
ncbi:MAG TPA: MFS transporter [Casimicrobiaceae bacterium]|nr:MFS transporter [Casimicrobiaceae bacterium]